MKEVNDSDVKGSPPLSPDRSRQNSSISTPSPERVVHENEERSHFWSIDYIPATDCTETSSDAGVLVARESVYWITV